MDDVMGDNVNYQQLLFLFYNFLDAFREGVKKIEFLPLSYILISSDVTVGCNQTGTVIVEMSSWKELKWPIGMKTTY